MAPAAGTAGPRIAMLGAGGRMGGAIIRVIAEAPDLKLTGAIEHAKSDKLGADVGQLAGVSKLDVPVMTGLPAAGAADVWIDFSSPEATVANAAGASMSRKVIFSSRARYQGT